jgi:hypothetical protein
MIEHNSASNLTHDANPLTLADKVVRESDDGFDAVSHLTVGQMVQQKAELNFEESLHGKALNYCISPTSFFTGSASLI